MEHNGDYEDDEDEDVGLGDEDADGNEGGIDGVDDKGDKNMQTLDKA